jgi:hypothetical protein
MTDLRAKVEPVLATCSVCNKLKSCVSKSREEVPRRLKDLFGRKPDPYGLHTLGPRHYFCLECLKELS